MHKNNTVSTNETKDEICKRIKGLRDITEKDINTALEYIKNNIPCMEFEKSCGTHIGCSTCPYEHFRWTVTKALEKVRNNIETE